MSQHSNRCHSFVENSFLKVPRDDGSDDDNEEAVKVSDDEGDADIFPDDQDIEVNKFTAADQLLSRRRNAFIDLRSTFIINNDADAGVASFSVKKAIPTGITGQRRTQVTAVAIRGCASFKHSNVIL